MTDLETMKQAAQDDITALLGYADELNNAGHPHAEELSQLAVEACSTDCVATMQFCVLNFFELVRKK